MLNKQDAIMKDEATPPPLPRPMQYVCFEGNKMGDRERMEDARKQALDWIHNNPNHQIESVDSSFGHMLAIVTVWYR